LFEICNSWIDRISRKRKPREPGSSVEQKRPRRIVLIVLTLLLSVACSRETTPDELPRLLPVEATTESIADFSDLFVITDVVVLETNESALIGELSKVVQDTADDTLLIGDFSGKGSLYRFSRSGRFIEAIDRFGYGPGEYDSLLDFTLTEKGDIVVVSQSSMIHYDRSGNLVNEVSLTFIPREIEYANGSLFVTALYIREDDPEHMGYIFDEDLGETGRFHRFDPRLAKYRGTPWNGLTQTRDTIYITHLYDLAISLYHTSGQYRGTYRLPSENDDLDSVWERNPLREEDEDEISNRIHRFKDVHPINGGLILLESRAQDRIYNLMVFREDRQNFVRYTGYNFMSRVDSHGLLKLWMMVGHDSGGIIGSIQDPDELATFQDQYEKLRDVTLTARDNPILVFLSLDE